MWYVLSQLRDKGLLSRIISAFQSKISACQPRDQHLLSRVISACQPRDQCLLSCEIIAWSNA